MLYDGTYRAHAIHSLYICFLEMIVHTPSRPVGVLLPLPFPPRLSFSERHWSENLLDHLRPILCFSKDANYTAEDNV